MVEIKIICLIIIVDGVAATISGLSYIDPIVQRKHGGYLPGEDPCHSLYWYPRQIPEYCNFKVSPMPPVQPVPVPIPVPMPMPPPPMPVPPPPMPMPQPPMPPPPPALYPVKMPAPIPMPPPMMPLMPQPFPPAPVPLPYGVPLAPSGPMIPVPAYQGMNYAPFGPPMQMQPRFGQMAGMMPGIDGLVTRDGGINVLPFSDVYSDIVDKHKNKMIRKKLNKLIKDYDRRFKY